MFFYVSRNLSPQYPISSEQKNILNGEAVTSLKDVCM